MTTESLTTTTATPAHKSNKVIVPILAVLLLLSVLLLTKDYYFNSSFYSPSTNDEAHINSLLSKDPILKTIITNAGMKDVHVPHRSQSRFNPLPRTLDAANCSGQGFFYSDINACQCFSCFSGASCQNFDQDCIIDDGGGNPLLFEEYWRNQSISPLSEDIYYRQPYQSVTTAKMNLSLTNASSAYVASQGGFLFPYLAAALGRMHEHAGNIADVSDKYVVFGHGCTQLIAASIYACNKLYADSRPSSVYAKVPYYQGYPGQAALGLTDVAFDANDTLDGTKTNIIEFVTYPNNPNNEFRTPTYSGSPGSTTSAGCTIYDQVYWWPSISNLSAGGAPLDTDVSLFSMSKMTGHAGTRFGWALVNDEKLAEAMGEFVSTVQGAVSIDAQHRVYGVLNMLLSDADTSGTKNVDLFFKWVRQQLDERWDTLNAIFNASSEGNFVQEARPGAFYAWIKCKDSSKSCIEQFETVGISPIDGTASGADSSYVRMELVTATPVWNIVVERLKKLIV